MSPRAKAKKKTAPTTKAKAPAKRAARSKAPTKKKATTKKRAPKQKKKNVVLFIPEPEPARPQRTGVNVLRRVHAWPFAGRTASRSAWAETRIGPGATLAWRANLAGPASSLPVVSEDGTLYVADREGELRALDVETGEHTFSLRTDPILGASPAWPLVEKRLVPGDRVPVSSSPAIFEWHLLYGDDEGIFYCLRRGEAQIIWRKAAPLSLAARGGEAYRAPVVAGGTLYVVDADGNLYAASPRNGTTLFARYLRGKPSAAPVVAGGRVVVATRPLYAGEAPRLHALDAVQGERAWHVELPGLPGRALAATHDSVIVGGELGLACYSLDRGDLRWVRMDVPVVGSIALSINRVFAPTAKGVVALDTSTGAPVWSTDTERGRSLAPVPNAALAGAGGVVWAPTPVSLVALDSAEGEVLGRIALPSPPVGGPIVAAGRLIVALESGEIRAYKAP